MDNIDNSFNRFWYIRIIIAIIVLTLTVKFALSSPAHLSESDSELIIKNAAFEVSEIITDAVTEEIPSTTEKTTEEKTTEKILTVNSSEKYETPEDIIKTEQEYISAYSGAAEGGSVEEVFFRTSGATDTISGIAIKNSTATKKPDFSALINEGPELRISDKSKPVVLIFHTHTTESYLMTDNGIFYTDYKTRSEDSSKNMVRVGDAICSVLEKNGIGYIHDTDIYDKNYDGAYSRSRISVERYLEEYPSIQIVIDVHRDAIYYSDTSRCKPTAEIDGKKAAQLMIISPDCTANPFSSLYFCSLI